MILGIGNDIVDLYRLANLWRRHPQRFPARILGDTERRLLPQENAAAPNAVTFLGGRWAAKEALGKALGCGLRAPLTWREIEVLNDDAGRPYFSFTTTGQAFLNRCVAGCCHLTISHDGRYAVATVVVENAGKQ